MHKREAGYAAKLAVVGGVAVLMVACDSSTGDCSPPPEGCPTAKVTTQLLASTIGYQIGTEAPVTTAVTQGRDSAADVGCSAVGWTGYISRDSSPLLTEPHVYCNDGSHLTVYLFDDLDPRKLSMGENRHRASDLGLSIEYMRCPEEGQGCTLCKVSSDEVEVTVKVDEFVGTDAPYPQMVTPDFSRQFHIELDTGPRPATGAAFRGTPLPCGNLTLKLSMNMAQSAANYVFDPHGECPLCL